MLNLQFIMAKINVIINKFTFIHLHALHVKSNYQLQLST